MTEKRQPIYLTGDWDHPPVAMAERLEAAGYEICHKWWLPEYKDDYVDGAMSQIMIDMTGARIAVIDMRSERYGQHMFPEAQFALGVQIAMERYDEDDTWRVFVIVPEGAEVYTHMLGDLVVTEERLFELLDLLYHRDYVYVKKREAKEAKEAEQEGGSQEKKIKFF